MYRRYLIPLAVMAVICITSCGPKAQLTGMVKDAFGTPIADVEVSIPTTSFKTLTSQDGKYHLQFAPGSFSVYFAKHGFSSKSVSQSVSVETSVPLQDVVLYERPPSAWIWLMQGRRYVKIAPGTFQVLNTRTGDSGGFSERVMATYMLSGQYTKVQPGRIDFIDSEPSCDCVGPSLSEGVRQWTTSTRLTLFRLSDNGVLGLHDTQYVISSPISIEMRGLTPIQDNVTPIGSGMVLRTAMLSPGRFAFVRMINAKPGATIGDLRPAYPAIIFEVLK